MFRRSLGSAATLPNEDDTQWSERVVAGTGCQWTYSDNAIVLWCFAISADTNHALDLDGINVPPSSTAQLLQVATVPDSIGIRAPQYGSAIQTSDESRPDYEVPVQQEWRLPRLEWHT